MLLVASSLLVNFWVVLIIFNATELSVYVLMCLSVTVTYFLTQSLDGDAIGRTNEWRGVRNENGEGYEMRMGRSTK